LRVSDNDRSRTLLRDTQRFGRHIDVRSPHPQDSDMTWERGPNALQAGFDEIPGVGEAIASAIIKHRETEVFDTWDDLQKVHGIGPKTVANMKEFVEAEDPFQATWLDRAIAATKEEIVSGKLGPLPHPTHVASDLPYQRGEDIEVVWLGTVYTRNVRDLFEYNQAKGAELDLENMTLDGKPIKDPHLREWCVMVGDDETDQMGLQVDRWKYPRFRDLVWRIRPGRDLILVRGVKPGWMPTRQIRIHDMWLIDPET